jgi:translation initiation factor IF-2
MTETQNTTHAQAATGAAGAASEAKKEPTKVYELAKELGLDSLTLLDKLRDLNIKVKNHMSELSDSEVLATKEGLAPKKVAQDTKSKAVKARRKSSDEPAASSPPEAQAKKPAIKASSTKTVRKAAPPIGDAAPTEESATPKAAPASAAVIRRRLKADGEIEIAASGVTLRGMTPVESPEAESESQFTESPSEELEASTGSAASELVYEEAPQPVETAQAQAQAEVQTPAQAPVSGQGQAEPPAPEVVAPVKKKAPIVLTPRPVAPRRSILTIVEAKAPPPKPMIKPPAPTPGAAKPAVPTKDGFRIIHMTKEGLDQMAEEEAAKKRGGGPREANLRPEDVRFADYRKKEMVFLPKKKRIPVGKQIKQTQITQAAAHKRVVEMQDTIAIQDFAAQMGVKAVDVLRKLMGMGQMATINQSIDFDTASLIAPEFQHEVKNVAFKEEALIEQVTDTEAQLQNRPPIVTIMGHVDHGKTSLLDAIREANVAAGEAGGITQHIGAYTIEKDGKLITFIDTPGHEAFTSMRARGANVTDIVILVVAADDGVMPQTREALSHAKAAGVPIIVAVNKIDKPGANPERIKQALAELDLLAEDWGGQTMFVPVSAIKRTNLDKLLESILLQAEVLDLKANPEAQASGTVLEARLEKGRGPVVSLLVRRGTLNIGDAVVAGQFFGRVKALMNHLGEQIQQVLPGMAAEVLGFEGVPSAGEKFDSPKTESDARDIVKNRVDQARAKSAAPLAAKMSLEELFSKVQTGTTKELAVILKADVFGSVEAVKDSLVKASTEKVKIKVILSATGGITESDVLLASASNAIIIGFNVRPETKARQLAEAEHIDVKCYNIIYELIDDVKKAMAGMLDKKKVEKFLGRAEVRQTFTVPKVGTIAGSAVVDGKILRGANVRLLRDSRVIYEGKMSSLKRFKDDAKEVAQGYECGIGLENYNDLKPGDLIEAYQIELIAPELT